jgi:hypothetical protein
MAPDGTHRPGHFYFGFYFARLRDSNKQPADHHVGRLSS